MDIACNFWIIYRGRVIKSVAHYNFEFSVYGDYLWFDLSDWFQTFYVISDQSSGSHIKILLVLDFIF